MTHTPDTGEFYAAVAPCQRLEVVRGPARARTSGTVTSPPAASGMPSSAGGDRGRLTTGGVVRERERVILKGFERCAGRRRWRNLARQTQVAQDSLDDSRLLNQGDEAQASPTRRGNEDVESETARHQARPAALACAELLNGKPHMLLMS